MAISLALSGSVARNPAPNRESVTLTEMQIIADALIVAWIDINAYVTLENLNDIGADGFEPDYDFIGDGDGTYVIRQHKAVFETSRQDLTVGFWLWDGPYVNYQPGRTDANDIFGYDEGTPLDPWGSPYYFFTPAGLVRPPNHITQEFYGDYFNQYTIVSFGPDFAYGGDDDIFYQWGDAPTVTSLTSLSVDSVRVGETLSLKGYKFGEQGDGFEVLLNGVAATDGFTTWTERLITKTILPTDPLGEVTVAVGYDDDDPTSPPLTVTILPKIDAADPGVYWRAW